MQKPAPFVSVAIDRIKLTRHKCVLYFPTHGGSRSVERHYDDFIWLEARLSRTFRYLPPLPSRSSFFCVRLVQSSLADREEKLNEFLRAIVQADPEISDPHLRRFFDVGAKAWMDWDITEKENGASWMKWEDWEQAKKEPIHVWQSNAPACVAENLSIMTSEDLARSINELIANGGIELWESQRWKHVDTLATVADGEGSVLLMTSSTESDQPVAVKRLPWKVLGSCPEEFNKLHPDHYERPWTDLGILRHLNSLRCPWSCELLGIFSDPGHVYIITSFANRSDLFAWCEADKSEAGTDREAAMRPIVSQIVAAVCWLHNLGIAHRDLSLENVLLTDGAENRLQVKVIDFAMATLSRTARQEVRGKPSYQAPEMHSSAEYDTFLADSFQVGIIVYCMGVHSYPWDQTKARKDRSFDLAQNIGLEKFLHKKKLPCNQKRLGEVFSECFLQFLHGLLDFSPEKRYSLGGPGLEKSLQKARARAELHSTSDISTVDSFNITPQISECKEAVLSPRKDESKAQPALPKDGPDSLSQDACISQWLFIQQSWDCARNENFKAESTYCREHDQQQTSHWL